jgi:hypothetical protein
VLGWPKRWRFRRVQALIAIHPQRRQPGRPPHKAGPGTSRPSRRVAVSTRDDGRQFVRLRGCVRPSTSITSEGVFAFFVNSSTKESRLHGIIAQPVNGARRSARCSAGEGVASASNSRGTTPLNPASRGRSGRQDRPAPALLARAGLLATRVLRQALALVPIARGTLGHASVDSQRVAGKQGDALPICPLRRAPLQKPTNPGTDAHPVRSPLYVHAAGDRRLGTPVRWRNGNEGIRRWRAPALSRPSGRIVITTGDGYPWTTQSFGGGESAQTR